MNADPLGARGDLSTAAGPLSIYRLTRAGEPAGVDLARLPHTVKILLENLLRRAGTRDVSADDVLALARWPADAAVARIAFLPSRLLMQDFTGVPAVVDLAALRSAVARAGEDAGLVNPLLPVDLIIDHSVQVDRFGSGDAYSANLAREYERNRERYALLRWAQQAFDGFSVVPPGLGICHQINLEHLGRVVEARDGVAFPDTVLGTDSHTPMINGLGILGWGVGGIEAEAAMLGQPIFLTAPVVVGIRTIGALPAGSTATDLVLTLTQMLRSHGVVGKFVEFFGAGLSSLTVEDRATLSNMSPEYGATASLFPVDRQTLRYLKKTGRGRLVDLVERYAKEQGLFRTDADPDPLFSETLQLDLSEIEPSLAGPKRPQDRVPLRGVWGSFLSAFGDRLSLRARETELGRFLTEGGSAETPRVAFEQRVDPHADPVPLQRTDGEITHGAVVIAAITSCTNTSNPSVMVGAGLLAKKAVEAGLSTPPWVKTSLAPGSRVVTRYLERAGLQPYLEKLGFHLVGYGCTTCIGNSGPLPEEVARAVEERNLAVAAVLSGNRNFEGRIHPQVRASYLASPPLVVAYALAGRIDLDLTQHPLGITPGGEPVFLSEVWPTPEEVTEAMAAVISTEDFDREYGRIFEGDEHWKKLPSATGRLYGWEPDSTYIREPPYFLEAEPKATPPGDILGARVLVLLGDSVTTDHISPAGSIRPDSPAGRYLIERGVGPRDFNSYGSRRGSHEVMIRGTFGNVRLQNRLAPGTEGPWTVRLPGGESMTIYDAAMRYQTEGVPLIVLAGKEYGSGSSRDWAAKGTALLGIRAVLAESFERIHRSNLVGMGVLPLQFREGDTAAGLGLSGRETFFVRGIAGGVRPRQEIAVEAVAEDGSRTAFAAIARIEAPAEADYYRHGGILLMVFRGLLSGRAR